VVIDTMGRLVPEQAAQVVVSTAHKAKGREWPRVRIADDFHQPKGEDTPIPQAEAMLAYVAVTRARLALDPDGLAWVNRWLATRPAPALEPTLEPPVPIREPATMGREVGHER
jgi:superfamily I DNA/RNA helicase